MYFRYQSNDAEKGGAVLSGSIDRSDYSQARTTEDTDVSSKAPCDAM